VTTGGTVRSAFGELGQDALIVELWVPRDQLAAGREVIEHDQAGHRAGPSASPLWRCSKCGSTNEATFDLCWSCQTPRAGA
jgi:hypothetical protein